MTKIKKRSVDVAGGSIVCYEGERGNEREPCFIEDEGRPLEVSLQERASNYLKLRR